MIEIELNIVCALVGAAWGWIGTESMEFWWKRLFVVLRPGFVHYFISGYSGPLAYLVGYWCAYDDGYNFFGKKKHAAR